MVFLVMLLLSALLMCVGKIVAMAIDLHIADIENRVINVRTRAVNRAARRRVKRHYRVCCHKKTACYL